MKRFRSGVPEVKASGSAICKFSSLPAKHGHTNTWPPVMPASLRNNPLACACSGIQWNGYLLLPAAGYRKYDSGAGINRGTNGFYWSAELEGTNSPDLGIYAANARIAAEFLSHGLSVRCVQAFTEIVC